MRSLRHFSCLIITLAFIVISLTGCTTSTGAKNPQTIIMWHYYKGSQLKILEEQINTFNSTVGMDEGIIVEAVSMRSPKEIYDLVITSANEEPGAPLLPSLVMAYPDAAVTFYDMDLLASYDDYFSPKEYDLYLDDFLSEGQIAESDEVYLFPISKSSEVLMINNTSYQAFLHDYNNQSSSQLNVSMLESFGGLLTTAEAYYHWTDDQTPDVLHDGKALFGLDSPSNFAISTFNQLDDDFFSEVDGQMTINIYSKAFNQVWDHYYVPMVKGYYAAYSFYRAEDTQTGDLLMYIGSTGGASFFPTTVTYRDNTQQDIQLKVLPYPVHDVGHPSAVSQGAGIALVASTPAKESAATTFLKWLTDAENNTDFILGSGYLPVTKKALNHTLPQRLDGVNDDIVSINVNNVIKVALEGYQGAGFSTYKPFNGSEDLRFYFEDMLLQRALDTRKKFIMHLEAGYSYEDACELYLSKSAFDIFVKEVEDELKELAQ